MRLGAGLAGGRGPSRATPGVRPLAGCDLVPFLSSLLFTGSLGDACLFGVMCCISFALSADARVTLVAGPLGSRDT